MNQKALKTTYIYKHKMYHNAFVIYTFSRSVSVFSDDARGGGSV